MLPLYPVAHSLRRIRSRAMSLLSELDMASKAMELVEHLSAGEQQRVALARALINDPQFLVADEPTAHLDTTLSYRFMEIVERLRKQGKTILMATHDPIVCESPATNRVVTMCDGSLQQKEEAAA
jgi:putative ABC transport system ATP-binding protein